MGNLTPNTERQDIQNGWLQSWAAVFKTSWLGIQRFDRSQLTALRAIRCTIGFALPLTIGVITQHIGTGVLLAVGAVMLGSIGLSTPGRGRTQLMLLGCLGVALSALVGSLVGANDWLTILAVGVWGFGAGLLAALGPTTATIGTQSTIVLIILSHFRLDPLHSATSAAMILAGSVFQTLLTLIPVPGLQTILGRAALATAYQTLANYALEPTNMRRAPQARDALLKAQIMLTESNNQSRQGLLFLNLLEIAEHTRMTILVLRRYRRRLQEKPASAACIISLDQLLLAAADQLQGIAYELQLKPLFTRHARVAIYRRIKRALHEIKALEVAAQDDETLQLVMVYGNALHTQLHTARKLLHSWKYRQSQPVTSFTLPRSAYQSHPWRVLRANLSRRSTTFRHAIRMSSALLLATAIYRLSLLPLENGYWISMTVLIVLKPDFGSTLTRGLARCLGTILGAFLITLLVALLAPSQTQLTLFSIGAVYLAFSILYANYALFSLFFTVEAVFLLAFVSPQPLQLAFYRAIDTTIGGLLVLVIFLLWPTWEQTQVFKNLADRLESLRLYGFAVLHSYTRIEAYDEQALHNLRMEARLTRSNAEASVTRLLQEPEPHHVDTELAQGLLAAENELAQYLLTLEAYLQNKGVHHASPEMADFSRNVDTTLCRLTFAIRTYQNAASLENLPEPLEKLKHTGKVLQARQGKDTDHLIIMSECQRIVDVIDMMYHILAPS